MRTITKYLSMLMVILSILVFASQTKAQVTLLTQGWETGSGTTPPAGWAINQLGYGSWTTFVTSGSLPSATPFEGSRMVQFDSWDASNGYENRLGMTTPVSTVGVSNITVDFEMFHQTTFSGDGIFIDWSTNGTTWTQAGVLWNTNSGPGGWTLHTQALPVGAANQATLYVAFRFHSNFGYNVYLDIMHIKGTQVGNLTGTVRNCFNNAVMANVPVSCGGIGPVLTNAGGVYTLNGINAGAQTITANFGGFVNYVAPVTVIGNTTTTYNFCMSPIPATLSGVVTNAANNAPIKGAKVVVNGNVTYSVAGGLYTLNVYPFAGSFPVTFTKAGFSDTTTVAITLVSGVNPPLNMAMLEAKNPASQPFTAALNGAATQVNLNWGLPVGNYELIYDDGTQELSTVWGTADNMNAEKFTPLAYPVTVVGGSVNIGPVGDYPGLTPPSPSTITPFHVQIYDANGTGGTPGAPIGSAVTVTPTSFGWNTFTIGNVSITSGNFYIVMTQAGTPPVAARLGQDTSSTQMRAFSKFGTGIWLPANGNFMIRAVVQGIGGPIDSPEATTGYQVYRLFQTQENNPGSWTSIGTPTTTSTIDPSWPSLPDSAYRWAVKAHYWPNRWSAPIFSNALGKNRTANVVVTVTPSCAASALAGSLVTLTCTSPGVDSVYSMLTNDLGIATFPKVWKGTYLLTVSRDGYTVYSANVSIYGDRTYTISILSQTPAPSKPVVDGNSLLVSWSPPGVASYGLDEAFPNFTDNQWNSNGYWTINGSFGNPSPCAELYYGLMLVNYDNVNLVSKTLVGYGASNYNLTYDIYLNNYAATGTEQMEVELQVNGAGPWINLAHYANTASIPWTTVTINLAAYTNSSIQIRFRAHGADMFDFNYWDVDNVKVGIAHPGFDPKLCILGYNVWLNNNIMVGSTPDTTYTLPNNLIVYGNTYFACVEAVYNAGTSARICSDPFTSRWLCPPTLLTGVGIGSTAYLTWQKPSCFGCTLATYQFETGILDNGFSAGAGNTYLLGNYFPVTPATTTGIIKSFDINFCSTAGLTSAQSCILYIYDAAHTLIGQSAPFINTGAAYPSSTWMNVPIADIPYSGSFYGMVDYTASSYKNWFSVQYIAPAGYPNGMAYQIFNGTWGVAGPSFGYPVSTFLQRANVCVNGKDKDAPITTIDPTPLPFIQPVTPALGVAVNLGANNSVDAGQPTSTLTPDAPLAVPPLLLGYHVYRGGAQIAEILNPNTLEYYDNNLNPGIYRYTVKGWYNVSPVSPLFDNSMAAGPVDVAISYGYPLPFSEPWTIGTFAYQQWTLPAGQQNWSINTALGDPLPCADFSWQPALTNYSDTLTSPVIDASAWTCADIWFDFDVKLIDRNATGNEKLDIDVFVNGNWVNKAELTNTGSTDWTLKHIDISNVKGKAFKVRFRANGVHSIDILHWYVDNINIYGVCKPPTTLAYQQNQFTTTLTWVAPECGHPGPTPQWIHWDDGTNFTSIGFNGAATWAAAARWTPAQIATLDGGAVTKINFWPASAGAGATFRARVWQGTDAATLIVDQPITTFTNDQWNPITITSPQPIDITQELWVGVEIVQTAAGFPTGSDPGPAIAGFGDMLYDGTTSTWIAMGATYGLDYNWNIQAYIEPAKKDANTNPVILTQTPVNNPKGMKISTSGRINTASNASSNTGTGLILPDSPMGSQLLGYNVYRTNDNQITPFYKINLAGPVTSPYTDTHPNTTTPTTTWKYFVTAVFQDSLAPGPVLCEPSSDTITITFPAVGINDPTGNSLSLYPNPANDVVNIVSTNDIKTIEVLNYIGQTVYTNNNVNLKKVQLNVTSFKAGVYFVKVTTTSGIKTTKITVTH